MLTLSITLTQTWPWTCQRRRRCIERGFGYRWRCCCCSWRDTIVLRITREYSRWVCWHPGTPATTSAATPVPVLSLLPWRKCMLTQSSTPTDASNLGTCRLYTVTYCNDWKISSGHCLNALLTPRKITDYVLRNSETSLNVFKCWFINWCLFTL